jgi:hypothetical protein
VNPRRVRCERPPGTRQPLFGVLYAVAAIS